MNTDFRISIGFTQHHKTKKLKRLLGYKGIFFLLRLWEYTSQNRPDGNLYDMTAEDIEIAVDWEEKDSLVSALLEVGFLKGDDGSFSVHDWETRNPWAAGSQDRSDKARLVTLSRINKEAAALFRSAGREGISIEEFKEAKGH